jgi:alpha-tubulin suppressor-like RCC1 family protein
MRYLAYLALSLSLASCSIVSSTPVLNDVLASKGDTRPFETPLPVNTQPKRLALGSSFAIGVKEDGTVWSWGYGMLGLGKFENRPTPQAIPNMTDFVSVQRPHPFFTIDRNGNNSSRRLFGHVGSFSKVSVNHANGSKPFNLAVANKL